MSVFVLLYYYYYIMTRFDVGRFLILQLVLMCAYSNLIYFYASALFLPDCFGLFRSSSAVQLIFIAAAVGLSFVDMSWSFKGAKPGSVWSSVSVWL